MAVGNYLSFNGAVEEALTKPKTSVGPVYREGPKFTMRDAGRGKGRTVNPKLLGNAGGKVPKAKLLSKLGKGAGKLATPLAAIEQAYQTGRLLSSEDARDEAAQDYENLADDNALMRTIKGGLGGVTTIYGAGRAVGDMLDTQDRAYKSERALEKKQMDPNIRQLAVDARERQAIYMSLPKEEQDKIDNMGGKERQQYFRDMKNPKPAAAPAPAPAAAPASSEPAPPSSPATAGAQKSPMERQMIAPKAIPVTDPNPEFAKAYRDASPAEKQRMRQEGPSAEPAKVDMDRAMALFQNTHGGPFDPKSSMDKGKMEAIQNLMAKKGSEKLTPNQFSLQIYRQS